MRRRKSKASSLLSVFAELTFTLGSVKMLIRLSSTLERLEWHEFTDSASTWKRECRTKISENELGYMTVIPASYTYEGRRVKSSKPASVTRPVWDTCDSVWKHKHFYYFFQTVFFLSCTFNSTQILPTSLPIQLPVISLLKEMKSNNKNKNQNIQTKKERK